MYISRAVQTLRDNPEPEEDITLLVEIADDLDNVRSRIETLSGAVVEEERSFDSLVVRLPQDKIDSLCAVDGITAIETADVLGLDVGDAGEDYTYGND